jgi:class 3 adenylate cyclase/CHASE3 domain sensor protein
MSVLGKLLGGFVIGVLLLVGMGALNLTTTDRMSHEVAQLSVAHRKSFLAHEMEVQPTAQSHYRAMAILTRDDVNNQKIATSKQKFLRDLDELQSLSPASRAPFLDRVRSINDRYTDSGSRVLALYQAGKIDDALRLHLTEEHPISHEIEAAMRDEEALVDKEAAVTQAAFDRDVQQIKWVVAGFSAGSIVLAILLGLVLSWAFVRPVRRVGAGLARLAVGEFSERVTVPNRDEFGVLTQNLNSASGQLATLYDQLRDLNSQLQGKVDEQVGELERVSGLKRYLSPQLASSIMSGDLDVAQKPRRRNLSMLYADLRGFTALAESTEPDELVDVLNEYLTAMTEVVFKYGGTLDKYLGRAILAFFGDPVQYDDNAERAIRTALEMRSRLAALQPRLGVRLDQPLLLSIGVSTGMVTVGNIGSPSRLEYTVVGNYVNLAARLATRAQPGQILVTERALVSAERIVSTNPVFNVKLPGVARRIQVFEVADATSTDEPAAETRQVPPVGGVSEATARYDSGEVGGVNEAASRDGSGEIDGGDDATASYDSGEARRDER